MAISRRETRREDGTASGCVEDLALLPLFSSLLPLPSLFNLTLFCCCCLPLPFFLFVAVTDPHSLIPDGNLSRYASPSLFPLSLPFAL